MTNSGVCVGEGVHPSTGRREEGPGHPSLSSPLPLAAKMAPQAKGYSYQPATGSLLFRYVLSPMYDHMVNWLPRWLTPNTMTVTGIVLTSISSFLLLRNFALGTRPTVEELVVAGLFNLVYMLLDNLDGKQARRIKMSSAIGEYLDHGGDCFTSLLSTWCMFTLSEVPYADWCLVSLVLNTGIVHLYHFKTGRSSLGGDLFSADEGMITFFAVPWLTAIFPGLWHTPVTSQLTVGVACTGVYFFGQALNLLQMMWSLKRDSLHPVMLALALSSVLFLSAPPASVYLPVCFTMVASYLIHHLIAGSCLRKHTVSFSVMDSIVAMGLPLAFIWTPQYSASLCLASIVVHLVQILVNCFKIIQFKRQ
eukprot:Sspe_Gene.6484::Locus_2185_Transcript_1_1_Confidence_1.000_Length_1961::g.6484::m.6484/K00993/EPT1; ethanolaminephosphotransferase